MNKGRLRKFEVSNFNAFGRNFVQTYYETVDDNRTQVSRLYLPNAILSWDGQSAIGSKNIQKFIRRLPETSHTVMTMDTQQMMDSVINGEESVLIQTSGSVEFGDGPPKEFTQHFLLTVCGSSWQIVSDTFRFVGKIDPEIHSDPMDECDDRDEGVEYMFEDYTGKQPKIKAHRRPLKSTYHFKGDQNPKLERVRKLSNDDLRTESGSDLNLSSSQQMLDPQAGSSSSNCSGNAMKSKNWYYDDESDECDEEVQSIMFSSRKCIQPLDDSKLFTPIGETSASRGNLIKPGIYDIQLDSGEEENTACRMDKRFQDLRLDEIPEEPIDNGNGDATDSTNRKRIIEEQARGYFPEETIPTTSTD